MPSPPTVAQKNALQAEANKLAGKLGGQGKNVQDATVSPFGDNNGIALALVVEWPDEPGKAFKLELPWLIDDGAGGFMTAEQYLKQGRMENKVNDVIVKKQLGLIKRAG